jgi:hypothetical protein
LYIEPDQIRIKSLKTQREIKEFPLIGHNPQTNHYCFGQEAVNLQMHSSGSPYSFFNPFAHPRIVISDFIVARKILDHVLQLLYGRKSLFPRLRVFIYVPQRFRDSWTVTETDLLQHFLRNIATTSIYILSTDEEMTLDGIKEFKPVS